MSEITDQFEAALPPPPRADSPPTRASIRPRPRLPRLTPAILGWLVVAAIAGDLALQTGLGAISSTVAIMVVAGPILGSLPRAGSTTRVFLILAIVFGAWLPVRASLWLTCLNFAAVVVCLLAAAVTQRSAAWRWDTATVGLVLSRGVLSLFFGPVLTQSLAPLRAARVRGAAPILRGVAIAALPVAILGALLASADAVFAQSIAIDVDPSSGITHLVFAALAAAAITGLIATTGTPLNESFEERRPLGAIEAVILLGSVGGLYAAFALVQLISSLGRADELLQEQGLTYAEYARSGFFQLLWVAALTVMLLGFVRMLVAKARPRLDGIVRILGAAVALLTIIIVGIAITRLWLYTDEFGQTTLRWYCTAFAWMLGAAFVAIAAGHAPGLERFLPATLLALVVSTLFTVNVMNPEARVAEHNLNRPDAVEQLDADFLTRLSADAWPAILKKEPLMTNRITGTETLQDRCEAIDAPKGYGIAGFNLALHRLDCG